MFFLGRPHRQRLDLCQRLRVEFRRIEGRFAQLEMGDFRHRRVVHLGRLERRGVGVHDQNRPRNGHRDQGQAEQPNGVRHRAGDVPESVLAIPIHKPQQERQRQAFQPPPKRFRHGLLGRRARAGTQDGRRTDARHLRDQAGAGLRRRRNSVVAAVAATAADPRGSLRPHPPHARWDKAIDRW